MARLHKPNMPLFEPSHDKLAASLLQQAATTGIDMSQGRRLFHFPADIRLWEEFKAQLRIGAESREPPLCKVTADHCDETFDVNRHWMAAFVGAWEQYNPHTVVVQGIDGSVEFRASDQFWADLCRTLQDDKDSDSGRRGDVVWITNHGDARNQLRTSTRRWNEVVHDWEVKNKCTAGQRQDILEERGRLGDAIEQRGTQSGMEPNPYEYQASSLSPLSRNMHPGSQTSTGSGYLDATKLVQLPYMSLPPNALDKVPYEPYEHDHDDSDFDFPADTNFWRCLQRYVARLPESRKAPNFLVGNVGEQLVVNRVFLKRFMAAWGQQFPLTIVIAMRQGKDVLSSAFYAHHAVWHELNVRSAGLASPENLKHIPDGYCLAHNSEQEEDSPPILLSIAAFQDAARMWPDQYPGTTEGFADDMRNEIMKEKERIPKGPKPLPAPVVSLPKPGKPGKRRRLPGAPKSKQDVPNVTLRLDKGILEGLGFYQGPIETGPAYEYAGTPPVDGTAHSYTSPAYNPVFRPAGELTPFHHPKGMDTSLGHPRPEMFL
ncbi:hypothetical protein DIPPA_04559 [Diplonema papillatum]|nr:hypothetical protein DIPPA_04559 [Diplonema papillatum]|eukprot:gene18997-29261_t